MSITKKRFQKLAGILKEESWGEAQRARPREKVWAELLGYLDETIRLNDLVENAEFDSTPPSRYEIEDSIAQVEDFVFDNEKYFTGGVSERIRKALNNTLVVIDEREGAASEDEWMKLEHSTKETVEGLRSFIEDFSDSGSEQSEDTEGQFEFDFG